MLPVYPLDFGRVVRLFSLKASKILSIITLVFICILCSYLIFYKKVYSKWNELSEQIKKEFLDVEKNGNN